MVGSVRFGAVVCTLLCIVGLVSANVPISNPTSKMFGSFPTLHPSAFLVFDLTVSVAAAALTSLKTILGVTVSFSIDGQTIAGNTSCTSQAFNSPCLAKVDAANSQQKVVINYNVLSNATLESTAHVILKVCYDKTSTTDRSWRKANNILVVSTIQQDYLKECKLRCLLHTVPAFMY